MRKILIISITSLLMAFLVVAPSLAMSDLAERFINSCYALDAPFPAEDWDKFELRDAAIEVLDGIENGDIDLPLTGFCLKALGYAGDNSDLPRVLAYYEDMRITVLRALSGFAHPDSVNFLISKTSSEEIPIREVTVISLAKIDFKKMDKPMDWFITVKSKLIEVRDKEKEDWLKDDITKLIDGMTPPPTEMK